MPLPNWDTRVIGDTSLSLRINIYKTRNNIRPIDILGLNVSDVQFIYKEAFSVRWHATLLLLCHCCLAVLVTAVHQLLLLDLEDCP